MITWIPSRVNASCRKRMMEHNKVARENLKFLEKMQTPISEYNRQSHLSDFKVKYILFSINTSSTCMFYSVSFVLRNLIHCDLCIQYLKRLKSFKNKPWTLINTYILTLISPITLFFSYKLGFSDFTIKY